MALSFSKDDSAIFALAYKAVWHKTGNQGPEPALTGKYQKMSPPISPPLPNFVDLLLDTVFVVDMTGKIVYVSAACERLLGYRQEEMIGQHMLQFIAPEDRERTMLEAARVASGIPRIGFENRYVHKNGKRVHIMWSARFSEADQLRIGVARDMTERRKLEAMQAATYEISEAAQSSADLPALLQHVYALLKKLVPLDDFLISLRQATDTNARTTYRVTAQGLNLVAEPNAACDHFLKVISTGQAIHAERTTGCTLCSTDSDSRNSFLAIPLVMNQETIGAMVLQNGSAQGYSEQDQELLSFVSTQIATALERKALHAELERLARHDELTGLPNRRLFNEHLHTAFGAANQANFKVTVMFIDIDGFKSINDTHGHATGDELLREVAARIKKCLRAQDMAFRMGGDEFVVLAADLKSRDDAQTVANKLSHAIEKPCQLSGITLAVKASIGFAVYPEDASEPDKLLQYADAAMYAQKQANRLH